MSPPNNGVTMADGVSATGGQTPVDITSIINGLMASAILPSNIPVGGSPFTYQNPLSRPVNILVSGGTVTTISWSRDNSNYFLIGLLAGQFQLSPGDYLRVVYITPPTMTLVPF